MKRRRIAVTGLGVKAPGGMSPEDLWATLAKGRSVSAALDGWEAGEVPVDIACQVRDFDPSSYLGVKGARRLDRTVQLAVGAGLDAVADAGIAELDPARCGVVAGTAFGGQLTLERELRTCLSSSCRRVSPLGIPMIMVNASAANLSMLLGWAGPSLGVTTGYAAGAHAIGEAARLIREDAAAVVLAGGAEACITPYVVASFWRMGVLTPGDGAPSTACRPFDRTRAGTVLGEGAGFVVLEDWDHAVGRGAGIHAELLGYGRSCNTALTPTPSSAVAAAAACMTLALVDADVEPAEIGLVSANGPGTRGDDRDEAIAMVKVFGADPPPVTAPKGTIGHLVGAAGAVEAVAAVLSLTHGAIPPTANFVEAGADIALDVVHDTPRPLAQGVALSNSFGFGGHNGSLVFRAAGR